MHTSYNGSSHKLKFQILAYSGFAKARESGFHSGLRKALKSRFLSKPNSLCIVYIPFVTILKIFLGAA